MQKFFGKLFLAVFFVLGNISGYLTPASLSYGDAPITGTVSINSDCIPMSSYDEENVITKIPFTVKMGSGFLNNRYEGYYAFFFAADETTSLRLNVEPTNWNDANIFNGGSARGADGGSRSNGVYTTNSSKEAQLILKITPPYTANYSTSEYCSECVDGISPINVKYKIYDLYHSYDEEFDLSEGLERNVSFMNAALQGDMVRYKFSGKKGDKIQAKATITDYGSIAKEKWEEPVINLQI